MTEVSLVSRHFKISIYPLFYISFRNHRIHLGNIGGVYNADIDGPRLRPNTTPIIMAAHRNNFYIVQLLLIRGATVCYKFPHFLIFLFRSWTLL